MESNLHENNSDSQNQSLRAKDIKKDQSGTLTWKLILWFIIKESTINHKDPDSVNWSALFYN